jgi:hypothetical protein
MAEPIFMKLGMYIMAPEPISTAYFINPSRQSVCLYVYPRIVASWKYVSYCNARGKHTGVVMGAKSLATHSLISYMNGPQILRYTHIFCFCLNYRF